MSAATFRYPIVSHPGSRLQLAELMLAPGAHVILDRPVAAAPRGGGFQRERPRAESFFAMWQMTCMM